MSNHSSVFQTNNTEINKRSSIRNVSFTGSYYPSGYYTDEEIRLAKKYLYVEDHWEPLSDEIWYAYSWWDRFFDNDATINRLHTYVARVRKLMTDLKNEIAQKGQRAKELEIQEALRIQEENEAINKQIELKKRLEEEKEIARVKQENIERQLSYEKIFIKSKEELINKFIKPAKLEQNNEPAFIPNGLLFAGLDSLLFEKLMNYCQKETGCEIKKINFDNLTFNDALGKIGETAKEAKHNDKRTIINIKNFDKLTGNNSENKQFIAKLKNFLTNCSDKYKCSIIINSNRSDFINEELFDDERLQKIDISTEKSLPSIIFYEITNGIRFSNPHKEMYTDLYLAETYSGIQQNTLWVDTSSKDNINYILDNIDLIKNLDKFRNINKIWCPKPDKINDNDFLPLQRYTQKGIQIFEKIIN